MVIKGLFHAKELKNQAIHATFIWMKKAGQNKSGKPKKRRWLLKILIVLAILAAIPVAIAFGIYFHYSAELPDLNDIINYRPPLISTIYDEEGRVIAEYFIERRKLVPFEQIPKPLIDALVSTEDHRFWTHPGVDYIGIARAFYVNVRTGHMSQGGSSLTQQLARTFYLSREKTFDRKIKEALLAYKIEKDLSKERILYLYLNQVYLGNSSYGVEAAAENYFHKTVDKLSLAEMAIIAGIPKAPSRKNPVADMQEAKERQSIILDNMVEQGKVKKADADAAKAEKLVVYKYVDMSRKKAPYFSEHVRKYIQNKYGSEALYEGGLKIFTTVNLDYDRYASEAVADGLRDRDKAMGFRGPIAHADGADRESFIQVVAKSLGKDGPQPGQILRGLVLEKTKTGSEIKVNVGGYNATISKKGSKWAKDLNMKPFEKLKNQPRPTAELVPGDVIEVKIDSVNAETGAIMATLEQPPMVQAGLICLDPFTGEIRAMIGGSDFELTEFNRAIQAKRQVGSSFKPIYYAAAIEAGYNPANVIFDSPVILPGQSKTWKPRNFGNKFSGPQTMYMALVKSINTISVKILQDIGIDYAISFAQQMGIDTQLPTDLTLALGTATMSISELARAYASIANGGERIPLVSVTRVYDRDGKLLENNLPDPDEEMPKESKEINLPPDRYLEHLQKMATRKKIESEWNMSRRKQILSLVGQRAMTPQTAFITLGLMQGVVHSGTGQGAIIKDWRIAGKTGTTNNYKDALFLGFSPTLLTAVWVGHDDNRLNLGRGGTGGKTAAPIFKDFMVKALADQEPVRFEKPEGIVYLTFDAETGTLPGTKSKKLVTAPFLEGTKLEPAEEAEEVEEDWFRQDFEGALSDQP